MSSIMNGFLRQNFCRPFLKKNNEWSSVCLLCPRVESMLAKYTTASSWCGNEMRIRRDDRAEPGTNRSRPSPAAGRGRRSPPRACSRPAARGQSDKPDARGSQFCCQGRGTTLVDRAPVPGRRRTGASNKICRPKSHPQTGRPGILKLSITSRRTSVCCPCDDGYS